MTRTVNVRLTEVAEHGELHVQIVLRTVRPRCIDYCEARAIVDVDGEEVSRCTLGLTRSAALRTIARWMFDRFGPAVARVGREGLIDQRTTVVNEET